MERLGGHPCGGGGDGGGGLGGAGGGGAGGVHRCAAPTSPGSPPPCRGSRTTPF